MQQLKEGNRCHQNDWSSVPKYLVQALSGSAATIDGVKVCDLPPSHLLGKFGEQGLFATKSFKKFDIMGEYCGEVVPKDVTGHYVAALEDKSNNESLGLDARSCGNEMRFINSYKNIGFMPNVAMKTAYVNGYPHIVIICMEDIEVGEEILLDYGVDYNEAYLGGH